MAEPTNTDALHQGNEFTEEMKCHGVAASQGPELGFWWNGEAPFWPDGVHCSGALPSALSSAPTLTALGWMNVWDLLPCIPFPGLCSHFTSLDF